MGQITATRNLVATKVVRLAGQLVLWLLIIRTRIEIFKKNKFNKRNEIKVLYERLYQ